jgi:invasion protein IalB
MVMNRRFFLKTASSAASLLAYGGVALPEATAAPTSMPLALAVSDPHLSWSVFSRNLQWLTTQAYAASNPYETVV